MDEHNYTLNKESEQDLVNLYETKYFRALHALVDEELNGIKICMFNKDLSANDFRFYQGRVEGLMVVLIRIKDLYEEAMKEPKNQ